MNSLQVFGFRLQGLGFRVQGLVHVNSLSRVSKICVWGWRLLGVFHDRFNEGIESSVIMLAGVYVDVVSFAYRNALEIVESEVRRIHSLRNLYGSFPK